MRARVTIGVVIVLGLFLTLLFQSESVVSLLRTANTTSVSGGVLPSEVSARNVLVTNLSVGEIVYAKKEDEVRPIASITKLFTAYAVYTSSGLDTEGVITWSDLATEGDAGSLSSGDLYTPRELLFPLLLLSSNDAGSALLRMIGEGVFAERTQALTRQADLTSTRIVGSTGLDSENTSTARDLTKLLSYMHMETPYLLDITQLSAYQGTHAGWLNNNPGVTFEGWRGGKHGYLPEAGRTFVGLFERGGSLYAIVLLGSENLARDLKTILETI